MFDFQIDKYQEEMKVFDQTVEDYKDVEGGLMPILQKTQDLFGYLPRPIIEEIASRLQIPESRIYGVATFYSQFSFVPRGENEISVCMGTACYVKGADKIQEALQEKLGIGLGETTADMKFSLVESRCVGDCAIAPIVVVNGKNRGKFKVSQVDALIEELRVGGED